MTNERAMQHRIVDSWLDTCFNKRHQTFEEVLAGAERLYEAGVMSRAAYRIAIYRLTVETLH